MTIHRFRSTRATHPVELEVEVTGEQQAPGVLLIPSLGRGRGDFDDLARTLADSGYRALALDPRGIGFSAAASFADLTLHDLADDAAAVLDHLQLERAHVVGHAFGNRVARCLCADHRARVASLTLLAAGGQVPPEEEAVAAFRRFVNEALAPEAFLRLVATANFAPTSDPSAWQDGWWLETAKQQAMAAGRTDTAQWWDPGPIDVLIVQGLDDRMAPPANGRRLTQLLGERATLVEIADAGHALLPEQPARVAREVLDFLRRAGDRGMAERRPTH